MAKTAQSILPGKMKTAFIIRMHFKENDPRWPWRLAFFKSMVLPKLLRQTDQDFDICMRVNPHHKEQVKELSDKIKIFDVKARKRNYIKPGYEDKSKRYFVDFVDYKDTVGLGKYEIQIGLDSDDLILRPDFVERVKRECERRAEETVHISFQPHIFHVPTLRNYRCPVRYGESKGSPIFALYQPKGIENYLFAYEDSHLLLPRYVHKKLRIEEGYCAYSVHACNSSTGLYNNARQILI